MLRALRLNPTLRPPSGWEEQAAVFAEMPQSRDPSQPLNYGEYYGRHLAQHYIFGAAKEIPGGSVMTGLAREMYPDWTPQDHLGLVAYGLEQAGSIRDRQKRGLVLACFLRDITNVLGSVPRQDAYEILRTMRQL